MCWPRHLIFPVSDYSGNVCHAVDKASSRATLIVRSMYQDYTAKGLTDKYATLSTQMDNVINDANTEIMGLRDKLQGQ